MNFKKKLHGKDRGVSPVIGVILMVAITVILAAVIATFVLGLGEQVSNTSPQASFAYEFNSSGNGNLTAIHTGGDTIQSDNVHIQHEGNTVDVTKDLSAGERVVLNSSTASPSHPVVKGDSVQVIWTSPDGDQTAVLSEW